MYIVRSCPFIISANQIEFTVYNYLYPGILTLH